MAEQPTDRTLADIEEAGEVSRYLKSQAHMDSLNSRIYDLRLRLMHSNAAETLKIRDELAKLTAELERSRGS